MMEFAIVGKKEVGKTLFMLQFAEYIAEENGFDCVYQTIKGVHLRKISDSGTILDIYDKGKKKHYLPHCVTLYTRSQQKFIKFIDTHSLEEGIQFNYECRKNIKNTLAKIVDSNYLVHIVDYTQVEENGLDPINQELYQFCKNKKFYIMLLNKTDSTKKMGDLKQLQKKIEAPMYPISAKYKEGFFHVYQVINSVVEAPVLSR